MQIVVYGVPRRFRGNTLKRAIFDRVRSDFAGKWLRVEVVLRATQKGQKEGLLRIKLHHMKRGTDNKRRLYLGYLVGLACGNHSREHGWWYHGLEIDSLLEE